MSEKQIKINPEKTPEEISKQIRRIAERSGRLGLRTTGLMKKAGISPDNNKYFANHFGNSRINSETGSISSSGKGGGQYSHFHAKGESVGINADGDAIYSTFTQEGTGRQSFGIHKKIIAKKDGVVVENTHWSAGYGDINSPTQNASENDIADVLNKQKGFNQDRRFMSLNVKAKLEEQKQEEATSD